MIAPSKPLYRTILHDALVTTRHHRELWLFGFFATFLQLGGVAGILMRLFTGIGGNGTLQDMINSSYPGAALIGALSYAGALRAIWNVRMIALIVALVALMLVLLWFVATAEAALVASVPNAKGKKATNVVANLNRGRAVGWQVVMIHVVSRLTIGVGFLLASLPLLLAVETATARNALLSVISFALAFVLVLTISFMTVFVVAAVVIDRESLSDALMTAGNLFRRHWIICIETALILFAVNVIVSIALALIVMLISVPATLLLIAGIVAASSPFTTLVITLFLGSMVALILFSGSLLTTFTLATWTLLYMRLRRHGATAKFVRVLHAIPHLLSRHS